MELHISSTYFALAALGVASHLIYFIRMDTLLSVPRVVFTALIAPNLLCLTLVLLFRYSPIQAALSASSWYTSYLAGVFGSMFTYRLFFHPLRRYKGPFLSRMTQLYHVTQLWDDIDHFKQLDKLHRQYGEYVRAGPNLLSISDPDIVNAAHAPMTKFEKGDWYKVGRPMTTLHQMTDRTLHDRRRRHGWDKAFTTKSLRSYDSRLIKYTNLLVQQLHKRSGDVVDARNWINYFAFDVMGDLAFGRSFQALENGEHHDFIKLMHDSGKGAGILGTMPWTLHTLLQLPIPASVNPIVRMLDMSLRMIDDRKKMTVEEPDIVSHLLDAGPFYDDPKVEKLLLMGDARLLIVAGSDTTATTLTFALYYLAKDKSLVKKLRDELDQHKIHSNGESFTPLNLAPLEYLNGFITECLRLHPPVPAGTYREPPKGGVTINGHFIPEGTVIMTPNYSIQRSPKAFVKPNNFIPERWTTEPELVLDKSAWFPFSAGRYSCIGKQLAMSEMRVVIAKLVLEFDVSLAKGEDGSTLLNKSLDVFTTSCAALNLVFTPR